MNINGIVTDSLSGITGVKPQVNTGTSFKDLIDDQLNKLNNSQLRADQMAQDFISGEVDDLHAVMIATEEARLSLDLALQIRNKVVEAYKEINNMQL